MRMLLVVVATLLLPAALAAQKIPPVNNAVARAKDAKDPAGGKVFITESQAHAAALAQVRQTLAQGKDPCCVPLKSDKLNVLHAALTTVEGKQVYLVAVGTPGVSTTARVMLDPKTGSALDVKQGAFQWGLAPAWFKQGLNSPPPARTR